MCGGTVNWKAVFNGTNDQMMICALNNKSGITRNSPSVRTILLFRLSGDVPFFLKQLTQQYQDLLPFSDPPTPSELIFLQSLQLLHDFSYNYDFCIEFASMGGHILLKKLLLVDSSSIIDLVEEIIGTITSTGCMFPTTTINEGLIMPTIHEFREEESIFHVFLRKVPQRMYGNSHERVVGYVLWNSAVIMSRWLVRNEKLLIRNKSVLEIGAGLGLCGLVAARYATSMTLTDWTNELLINLDTNVGLNSGLELINGESGSVSPTCACDVRHLDWSKYPHIQHASQDDQHTEICDGDEQVTTTFLSLDKGDMFDVIIGSDIVYCHEDAVNVPKVLWQHLKPLGWFLMVQPQPQHRYGSEYCVVELKRAGFEVYSRPIAHSCSTSPAVSDSTISKTWQYESNENDTSSWKCFIDTLEVHDDELVQGLDEQDYCAWILVVARKPSLILDAAKNGFASAHT